MGAAMKKALTVLACFTVAFAVSTSAGWSTKIYDPSTKKWVTYDAKRSLDKSELPIGLIFFAVIALGIIIAGLRMRRRRMAELADD